MFPTPPMGVVAGAQQKGPESSSALETLCRTYWQPVYFYIRKRGFPVEEAIDLTQDFLARVLERCHPQQRTEAEW